MTPNNTIGFFKVFLIASLLISVSQRSIADNNTVVAKVADQEITFGQVAKAYNKNLPEGSKTLSELKLDSVMGFIDLYSNYRLKVIDALDKGYHQKPEIVQEIRQNQERLAESHLLNSMLIEPHVEKIKQRRLSEFKMAYILLREDSTSSMSPTEKAEMIIGKLDAGEPFSKLAKKYSMDPSTSEGGGILDVYVTSGRIQPDLEDALYSLEVGQYHPEPITNQFGTFVVKLHDKQPRIAVKSAHILIAAKQVGSGDWEIKEKLADSIYQAIQNGASFEEMVEKHSSDETSVANGGVLEGWYVRSGGFIGRGGKLVEEYEDKLFELQNGEISEPVKTKYGYHIIKRVDSQQANADEEEDGIKDIYRKTLMETERRVLLDSIRQAYVWQ
jgi:peptidyl-prolyl cis-trans isomerase SurA